MRSLQYVMMSTPGERLKAARTDAGYRSARSAALEHGWPESTYNSHERAGSHGARLFDEEWAKKYARAFRVDMIWLLHGVGAAKAQNIVPIMGYVGAGAEIYPDQEQVPPDGLSEVELPMAIPEGLIGLEVSGESMLPRYDPGDVIIVWREQRRPIEALLGEEAAVRTEDGRRFLKRIMRGSAPRTFNLESWNARTIEAVGIEWVGEIYLLVRAGQIRRIEQRERVNAHRRATRRAGETAGMEQLPLTGSRGEDH